MFSVREKMICIFQSEENKVFSVRTMATDKYRDSSILQYYL